MTEYPWHQSLHLQNFTVFKDTKFDFVPGVNALVGENGTGKTHLMKALYAAQLTNMWQSRDIATTLRNLFQTQNLMDLVRLKTSHDIGMRVAGLYHDQEWFIEVLPVNNERIVGEQRIGEPEHPVFIPAIDMMGHTRGFLAAARAVVLDFDLTCEELVTLFSLERRLAGRKPIVLEGVRKMLGGDLQYDEGNSRFYLVTPQGRLPMPLVAEGLRKIATLVRLAQNGWLVSGTTLFWDEPEVNLNPLLMGEVVGAILSLARQGIQVFLATHSYVILKELDLQAKATDSLCYFALQRSADGTTVNPTDDFDSLNPNPILEQYNSLYDRQLTRSTGRNSKGERVR